MTSARAPFLCLLLAACAHVPESPTRVLDDAAAAARSPTAPARVQALAGFHAYLVDGSADGASRLFQAALVKDAAEPYALTGTLVLADRVTHPEVALEAALELCVRAPNSPLGPQAAHTVSSLAGRAQGMDARILSRAPEALAHGAAADTAFHLRVALASVQARRDAAAAFALRADAGLVTALSLVGPLAALRDLAFDTPTRPERDGALSATLPGPLGSMALRTVPTPDGELSLSAEGTQGDVYLAAVDVEVAQAATYVVRTGGNGAYRAVLDGTVLYDRRPFASPAALVSARGVSLAAGKHRLLLVLLRGERGASVSLAVSRADGQPAGLRFSPSSGAAPRWAGVPTVEVAGVVPTAADVREALLPQAGPTLATYLAVRDAEGRDKDGAKRLLAAHALPAAPAWSALQAQVALQDGTLPQKVSRSRAAQFLDAALAKDAGDVESLLTRASLALDEQRMSQAGESIRAARAAHAPVGYPVDLLEARLSLAIGLDAQGDAFATEALKSVDGICAALGLRYDLAMRREAVAESDRLLGLLKTCPGEEGRAVEHAKVRGHLAEAASLAEARLALDPASVALALGAATLELADKRPAQGVALLLRMHALWPRNANVLKQLAELQALVGDAKAALASRQAALVLDGGDLTLRRLVERQLTGKEVLQEQALDGRAALKAYQAGPHDEEAPSVLVLDAAATRAYADGSSVDRIHTVQKVLDQSGIQEVAEVSLPPGAQLLSLRTLKADGKVLEPETIEGKETISMPGVAVGDSVEQEFLLAHQARGPAVPGWTAGAFYYQVNQTPDHFATYTVLAPSGAGMAVDAHNMTAPKVATSKDGSEVFHQEVRNSPAFVPEPEPPPGANEVLPLVLVGAGARGQEQLLTAGMDNSLERLRPNAEVEVFARAAAGGRTGLDAVRAVYAAVHGRLVGRDAGMGQSASASLAQDRGSRLALLRASLATLGIPVRLVAVRTFATDPAPYTFPNEGLFPYLCLRVEPKGTEPVWLDTLVRYAPFGELPEQASGGREAYLLPEPGLPLEHTQTPTGSPTRGKEVTLDMSLDGDGTLTGKATDVYRGFEAAQLAEALEALSTEERQQALQSALSAYFGGAELSDIQVDAPRAVGATVTVHYTFRAAHFARQEGQRMVLGPLTYPTFLGRRFVQAGQRRLPLFIEATEAVHSRVTLTLPTGWVLDAPLPKAEVGGVFGRFTRAEAVSGGKVSVDENYRLDMARIPVARYDAFAQFAGEVDLLQSRDVVLRRPGFQPNTASAGARGTVQ